MKLEDSQSGRLVMGVRQFSIGTTERLGGGVNGACFEVGFVASERNIGV